MSGVLTPEWKQTGRSMVERWRKGAGEKAGGGTAVWPRGGHRASEAGTPAGLGEAHTTEPPPEKVTQPQPSVPRQGSATSGPRDPPGNTRMAQELGLNPVLSLQPFCDPGEPGQGSLVRSMSLWRRKDSFRPGLARAAPRPSPSTEPSLVCSPSPQGHNNAPLTVPGLDCRGAGASKAW